MHVQREDMRAGLHRANGVLNWQGVPDNHPVREHLQRFCEIVAELERCFDEASRDQINALLEARPRNPINARTASATMRRRISSA